MTKIKDMYELKKDEEHKVSTFFSAANDSLGKSAQGSGSETWPAGESSHGVEVAVGISGVEHDISHCDRQYEATGDSTSSNI